MTTNKNNMTTLVNFILDKSGSMGLIQKDTIGGFNRYLKDLQRQKGKILMTLTVFADNTQRLFTNINVKAVKPLNEETYCPNGSTALYDAAVFATEDIAQEVKKLDNAGRVLTVVLTDGEENASQEHNQACFRDLIKELEAKGNWTFVYLGANQDSWSNASAMGYSSFGNVGNFQASAMGIKRAFASLSDNTVMYCASSAKSVTNFNSLIKESEIK